MTESATTDKNVCLDLCIRHARHKQFPSNTERRTKACGSEEADLHPEWP